jgi:hypothetical protein
MLINRYSSHGHGSKDQKINNKRLEKIEKV